MTCRRFIRPLSFAAVIFFGMACATVALLWVRSYQAEDRVSGHYANSTGVRFYSSRGWLVCSKNPNQRYPWALELGSDFWLQPGDDRLKIAIPADFFRNARFASISMPHTLLLAVIAGLAAIAWPRKSYRFSLRTLLMVTTLVAILLGLTAITFGN